MNSVFSVYIVVYIVVESLVDCLQSELIHTRHELLTAQKQVDSLTEKTREVVTFDACCRGLVHKQLIFTTVETQRWTDQCV